MADSRATRRRDPSAGDAGCPAQIDRTPILAPTPSVRAIIGSRARSVAMTRRRRPRSSGPRRSAHAPAVSTGGRRPTRRRRQTLRSLGFKTSGTVLSGAPASGSIAKRARAGPHHVEVTGSGHRGRRAPSRCPGHAVERSGSWCPAARPRKRAVGHEVESGLMRPRFARRGGGEQRDPRAPSRCCTRSGRRWAADACSGVTARVGTTRSRQRAGVGHARCPSMRSRKGLERPPPGPCRSASTCSQARARASRTRAGEPRDRPVRRASRNRPDTPCSGIAGPPVCIAAIGTPMAAARHAAQRLGANGKDQQRGVSQPCHHRAGQPPEEAHVCCGGRPLRESAPPPATTTTSSQESPLVRGPAGNCTLVLFEFPTESLCGLHWRLAWRRAEAAIDRIRMTSIRRGQRGDRRASCDGRTDATTAPAPASACCFRARPRM
jgi:hypothetical protein